VPEVEPEVSQPEAAAAPPEEVKETVKVVEIPEQDKAEEETAAVAEAEEEPAAVAETETPVPAADEIKTEEKVDHEPAAAAAVEEKEEEKTE
jgi:hypothetical protein